MIDRSEPIPDLRVGLNVLWVPSHRSMALHRVVSGVLPERDGAAVWIDARDVATTHALYDRLSSSVLRRIRIARSWTAYQHHELVRRLPADVDEATGIVIAPAVTSLYEDDGVPAPEARWYLESSIAILAELGVACECPVLASVSDTSEFASLVAEYAAYEIDCESTDLGYRFDADGFETLAYWDAVFWQTTIPYWVALLGVADNADLAVPIHETGLSGVEA